MKRFFIKFCFFIITILFFTNTVCIAAPNSSKIGTTAEFILYESKSYNFQINYPGKWKVVEGFMGVEAIVFLSPLENDNDKFSENVNVFIEDLTKYPGLTLNKYEGLNLDQLSKLITDFRIIERKDNVISGMPARIIIFSGRQGIYHIKQMQTYIIANNRAYVITFTAEETQYRNYEEVAKKIVNSILIKLNT